MESVKNMLNKVVLSFTNANKINTDAIKRQQEIAKAAKEASQELKK
jgi:hypothetical protein